VNIPHDNTGTQVKILLDDLKQLRLGDLASTVVIDVQRKRLGNADGVGDLNKATASQAGSHDGLGDPPRGVRGTTVDLAVVLAGERTTSMGAPAAVGVDNDLAASETSITLSELDTLAKLQEIHGAASMRRFTWGPPMMKRPEGLRW
jgi:hypothetical protein